jgi:hypothetical protein
MMVRTERNLSSPIPKGRARSPYVQASSTISMALSLIKRIIMVYTCGSQLSKPCIAPFNGFGVWLTLFVLITDTLRSHSLHKPPQLQ